MRYEFLPHTADVKVRVVADSLEEAFAGAVAALKEAMCGDIRVKSLVARRIEIEGRDLESLLYGFIEEFLYLLDAKGYLVAEVSDVAIDGFRLSALAAGDEAKNYAFNSAVKAVTYSEMSITRDGGGWVLEFVLDT